MARVYAFLTKIVFLLGVIVIIVCRVKEIIGLPVVLLAILFLFLICFPGFVINDLQNQIDDLRKDDSALRRQIWKSEANSGVLEKKENTVIGNGEWKITNVNGIDFLQKVKGSGKKFYCRFCHSEINPKLCGCPNCGKDL